MNAHSAPYAAKNLIRRAADAAVSLNATMQPNPMILHQTAIVQTDAVLGPKAQIINHQMKNNHHRKCVFKHAFSIV